MKPIITKSLIGTEKLAKDWLFSLNFKNTEATVVGLYGNLGSGKTTFTQSVAKALSITENITSPTFVIEKLYETKHEHFKRLIHIDAYRIEEPSELQDLNFEEIVSNPNNLIIIEWPENVKEVLPEDHIKIHCAFVDESSREFRFEVQ